MKLLSLYSLLLLGFLFAGCPCNEPKGPPLPPEKPSIYVDMPRVCGAQPMLKTKLEEYKRDPIFGKVAQDYIDEIKKLEHDKSLLGETFIEYPADPNAGYSKDYVVEEDPESYESGRDTEERELIPVSRPYLKNETDIFGNLYELKEPVAQPVPSVEAFEEGEVMDFEDYNWPEWEPKATKRVAGFVFAGYKIPPERMKENCGHWSDLFNVDRDNKQQRKFEALYASKQKGDLLESPGFSVVSHIFNTTNSIFLSTSRSIYVARRFAIGSGARRKAADEAWVYAILVHNAFDTRDPLVKPFTTGFEGEQEISVSGIIEWSDIVGYRKIVREPSPGAPPEFVGPIYLRERLKNEEPEAFSKIMTMLSMKSKYTHEFENGRPWKGKVEDERMQKQLLPK